MLGGLLALLSIFGFLVTYSAMLPPSASFLGGQGRMSVEYVQGDSSITSALFVLPAELGQSITVTGALPGWSYAATGGTISLTGGSLQPGQTLWVQYALDKYVSPGTFPVEVTLTPAQGAPVTNNQSMSVDATLSVIVLILQLPGMHTIASNPVPVAEAALCLALGYTMKSPAPSPYSPKFEVVPKDPQTTVTKKTGGDE